MAKVWLLKDIYFSAEFGNNQSDEWLLLLHYKVVREDTNHGESFLHAETQSLLRINATHLKQCMFN
jgi:hypothetical protein